MEALPRLAGELLRQRIRAFPITVLTGARQTGKSTLVRAGLADDERLYVTLDTLGVRDEARRAPADLVRRAPRMTLDEVQRAPDLLLAVKAAADEERRAGRFVLTGSANLLLMRQVSETLAGRAQYLTLAAGMSSSSTRRAPGRNAFAAGQPRARRGRRWRGAAAIPRPRWSWLRTRNGAGGSTATRAPTSSAICRNCPA